ncbi:hypothetical protein ABTG83_20455, partial [Acinetobacter baumannii]
VVWARTRSGLALRARRWRFRHGIAARQVAIRSHAPWWLKLLVAAGVMALALAAARGIYDAGRGWVGLDVDDMQAEVVSL